MINDSYQSHQAELARGAARLFGKLHEVILPVALMRTVVKQRLSILQGSCCAGTRCSSVCMLEIPRAGIRTSGTQFAIHRGATSYEYRIEAMNLAAGQSVAG